MRMLIGTTLGGCLKSLASGEVSMDDVLCVITRTNCKTKDALMNVVRDYHDNGNGWATVPINYQLGEYDLEKLMHIADTLWDQGRIHQPRSFGVGGGFIHPMMTRDNIWLEIAPTPTNNPAVVDAYQKYKMLLALTKDEDQY